MFKPNQTYTHKKMLDCCVLVLALFRVHDGRYKLRVRWFNSRGLDLGVTEVVTIRPEEMKNWYLFSG